MTLKSIACLGYITKTPLDEPVALYAISAYYIARKAPMTLISFTQVVASLAFPAYYPSNGNLQSSFVPIKAKNLLRTDTMQP
ncbi:hypothetical protein [Marinomonas pollencensis]|uniref:hypothetical protein n=1 Tax=Marinomonas pollencensis TaxID=491954 RepID=UPI000E260A33|nr:hypothetical protein [Marinomonas pollencensis]